MARLTLLFLATGLTLLSGMVEAAVVTANSCSSSDVQSAINSAASGDTVNVPAPCTATWNTRVSIPGTKGITLKGNGANIVRGSLANGTEALSLSANSIAPSRITGFVFTSSSSASNGVFITVRNGNEGSAKFRIDNCTFIGRSVGVHVKIASPVYGVIDHNSFTWEGNNEVIHNEAYGSDSTAGWSNDVAPGSADAVYIEDNTFTNEVTGNPAYFLSGSALQSYYGARTVFRYNRLTMAHVDQHGTAGMIGARWWEIYENTFYIVQNGNQNDYIQVRGGSGVIFNNRLEGFRNLGSGVIRLYEEDSGYPALYQVGRGKNQVLDPAYVWGNDADMPVSSQSSNVQVNRDFYKAPKSGYTPYVYPHPLVTGGTIPTNPGAPTNVRVIRP
jgi:hypothetical protein